MVKNKILLLLLWLPFYVIGVLEGARLIPWYIMVVSLLVSVTLFTLVIYTVEFESHQEGLAQCKAEVRWSVLPHVDQKSLVEEVEEISEEINKDKK